MHLKHVKNYIDKLDRSMYWQDLLYTPLEADIQPFQIIPPEFIVLKRQRKDQLSNNRFGVSELKRDDYRRYRDILDVFDKHREPLIILGDPGAGKSVSFRHAVREMVRTQSRWWIIEPLIPIYISCGHYTGTVSGHPIAVETFIREYVQRTFSFFQEPAVFNDYLLSGRLVFFFDALDEMPKSDYSERINLLSDFAVKHSHNRIFFSCRKLDYDKRLNVREVNIRPFDRERRRLFLRKGLAQTFDRQVVKQLIYQLETNSKLSDLLSNPFFCQLVIFYVQILQTLPSNRYQLFAMYIDRRLLAEQSRWVNTSITPDQVVDCLSTLAYLMSQAKGVGTSINYDDAVQLIQKELPATSAEIENLIRASAQAKLLLQLPEHNLLQFSHHRLQEYFAALYATKHILWEKNVVKKFADDLWWREILIMMMGMEGDQSQKIALILEASFDDCRNLFELIIQECEDVVQQEHSQHDLTCAEEYSLRKSYISEYLDLFDVQTDEHLLVQNLLKTEGLINALEIFAGRKETNITVRVMRRILPSAPNWAPPGVINTDCYERTVCRFAERLNCERDSLRNMRRVLVNRLSLAISCATNCNLHLGSPIWNRLRECALLVLKGGVPLEQVKIVKEIVTQDDDHDVRKQLRRLLTGDSRWLGREIFNTLLDYRIPHVGFDKRSIFFLWRELNYYGSTGTFREYGAQLINSSIRLRSLSMLSVLTGSYLLFLATFTGLMPWAIYQGTQLEVMKFSHIIKSELVLPLCWIPIIIVLALDLIGFKFMGAIGMTYGFCLSMLIWGFTGIINVGETADFSPRPVGLSGKIVLGVIACCLAGVLVYWMASFFFRAWLFLWHAYVFWLFKRRWKKDGSLIEEQLSTKKLLEFYKRFKSVSRKAMVIKLLEQHAEYDEVLINTLTDLAYKEADKSLADGLWHLIYELEKRQLRAA